MFNKKKKIDKDTDIGKIITTAEITITFGFEFKPIYEEHTQELFKFINKHAPDKKALTEIRWEEETVVLRAQIDHLYEVIYLFGYATKMIDDWITQAIGNNAKDKFDVITEITGNLNIN
jgi:predicted fused transcriptional regulator/phosphomethylpyrimidine kinase